MSAQPQTSFDAKAFVESLPARPGVYRMLAAGGEVIYVGKARNLKSRVSSYFQPSNVAPKVQALVRSTASMEVTIAPSDIEALLLEHNLIKAHRPRFNVVLRDDKSFPYVRLSTGEEFARLSFYRGSKREPGRYFGPYPSAGAVRQTLQEVQKLFRLRNCENTFFANRTRPCLQFQIARCTAPCVDLISAEEYARDVEGAVKVLEGHSEQVGRDLAGRMEDASERLDFESAARLRDQLASLRAIQAQQAVSADERYDADVLAVAGSNGDFVVSLMFVRAGKSLGSTAMFPQAPLAERTEVLSGFLTQYYLEHDPPPEIIVEERFDDADVLEATLSERAGHRVRIATNVRGLRARWLQMMQTNAAESLKMRNVRRASIEGSLEELRRVIDLAEAPRRLECFDISHTGGTDTVASCVVFGPEGPIKSEYRRFNISGIAPGDDYGAMSQALARRYRRIRAGEVSAPDVLLIDGGRGQLTQAAEALMALEITGIALIGVAKGADRRPGQERLFVQGQEMPIILTPESSALHLIQRVRDEAHRFAISGHRRRRAKRHNQSILETIPGLGPVKRRELLQQFGGMQGILRAGTHDLSGVRGVGPELAQIIYEHLHPGN